MLHAVGPISGPGFTEVAIQLSHTPVRKTVLRKSPIDPLAERGNETNVCISVEQWPVRAAEGRQESGGL
jgi:hypothetical protein